MLTNVTAPRICTVLTTLLVLGASVIAQAEDLAGKRPAVGDQAADFKLSSVAGTQQGNVQLSAALKEGPVVLVVLRGYPESHCPACSRQVGDFIGKARKFADQKAQVLLVYPGGVPDLQAKAGDFLQGTVLPQGFTMLLDPDYTFTNAYGLRWDAPRETAYPSTFVIDQSGKVRYAKVSTTHKGRADAAEVVETLMGLSN